MANVDVLNWKNQKVGQVELTPEVFEVPLQIDLLHTVVRWQLAKRRQGTAMTKTKGLVSGGGKKPFKQKGTGNARQGSIRSPLMPGGGTVFGPEPRSYEYTLPKRVRRLGLRMALSHLLREGRLFVVEEMKSEGKTAELSKRLKGFGLNKAVLVDGQTDALVERASRNLVNFKYLPVGGLNVYDLLKYDAAVITKASVQGIVTRCLEEGA
ncbi:MAG: 50S ribosomal protein L4 [Bdellovibrionaceae bacterium]|nr:50S ribosomal protein L4 [Pseudobdellovibrionaceae bacterium]